jgi:large subunit ribosomal protein L29
MAKQMQADEIREMQDGEIRARVLELEEERFRLRFRGATQPLEDPLRLRVLRKEIARLNTVLRERTSPGRALTSSGT